MRNSMSEVLEPSDNLLTWLDGIGANAYDQQAPVRPLHRRFAFCLRHHVSPRRLQCRDCFVIPVLLGRPVHQTTSIPTQSGTDSQTKTISPDLKEWFKQPLGGGSMRPQFEHACHIVTRSLLPSQRPLKVVNLFIWTLSPFPQEA